MGDHSLRGLHFYETFTIVNLLAIGLVAHNTLTISPVVMIIAFTAGLLPYALLGVFIRVGIAAIRREHAYMHIVRTGMLRIEVCLIHSAMLRATPKGELEYRSK